MYTVEKFKNAEGEVMARIDLESNTLPYVTIDTYQTFTGDSWLESEFEWLKEESGIELDWSNADVEYNHDGIKKGLAESSIAGILDNVDTELIESIDYVSNWSPSYYNFETDTYTATYVVNWTRLKQWLKESGKDREEWMRERWSSYDGFHSHMYPGYWNDPEWRPGMKVYATIAMYLQEALADDMVTLHVAEEEWEIYQENARIYISESNYEDMVAAHIAETVGQEFDSYDALPALLEARGQTLEALMQEWPLNPVAAADKLMQRPDDEVMAGQMELL